MTMLDPEDRRLIREAATRCAELSGALGQFEERFEEAIRGVHHRVGEVKSDAERDVERAEARLGKRVDEVRSDVRRPAMLSGGGAAAVVSLAFNAVKEAVWPS